MDVEPQLNRKQIGVGGGGNPLNTVNSLMGIWANSEDQNKAFHQCRFR